MATRATNRREESAELAEARETSLDRVHGTPVKVDEDTFVIGKLSINQIAAIARLALKQLVGLTVDKRSELVRIAKDQADAEAAGDEIGKQKAISEMMANQTSNIEALFAILDEDTIAGAVGIVIDRDANYVEDHVGALETIEIIDAVFEQNDAKAVYAAFLRLIKRFSGSTAPQ